MNKQFNMSIKCVKLSTWHGKVFIRFAGGRAAGGFKTSVSLEMYFGAREQTTLTNKVVLCLTLHLQNI